MRAEASIDQTLNPFHLHTGLVMQTHGVPPPPPDDAGCNRVPGRYPASPIGPVPQPKGEGDVTPSAGQRTVLGGACRYECSHMPQ